MREILVNCDKIELDNGVFFGKGVFETILIKERPVFIDYHLDRLNRGLLEILEEPIESREELKEYINNMGLKDRVLKITVTEKNIILTDRENNYKKEDYDRGFSLKISRVLRNSTSILNKIKSTAYIENILENKKAKDDGFNDCVFINEKGNICETSTGNIFFVKDDIIYTPNLNEGLLDGTVRDFIIKKFNVKFKELKLNDIECFDEAFVTNSIIGVMKVTKIGEKQFCRFKKSEEVLKSYEKEILKFYGGI